jgi:sugar/nucleoside kinase (ribokinase family)
VNDVNNTTLAADELGPTVCVGEILVEIMATNAGTGFLKPMSLIGPYPSGAPAIFIDQCARIGGKSAIIGAVGDDDFGRVNIDRLKRDGAITSGIVIDPEFPTGSAFVRYRRDGSRDFVYNITTSAAARFGWSDNVKSLIEKSGHLHIMGSTLSMPSAWIVIEKAIDIIKQRGGTLSFDPNFRKELKYDDETIRRFKWLVSCTDLLLPSGEELEHAANMPVDSANNEAAAVTILFELGVGEIVLKRGAKGATCYRPGQPLINSPAFIVDELDPTGAGDCFGGAYVACRRLGLESAEALLYANAAGARNVTVRGPMEGAGTRAELDLFISKTQQKT